MSRVEGKKANMINSGPSISKKLTMTLAINRYAVATSKKGIYPSKIKQAEKRKSIERDHESVNPKFACSHTALNCFNMVSNIVCKLPLPVLPSSELEISSPE
ncbi:hypothetical protein THF1A12_250013 [Vibrio jasicida]|uniref:Uncharacterized protein n=1 Tax=Vibrio jasicida TaxID=766224 RepID=A0AAU9QNF5_9VIBR|nr:hypothetical protein THF1A12_250013 [Vibrio jasicida]